jgi:geranylgeranyl diphosphate synthase type II
MEKIKQLQHEFAAFIDTVEFVKEPKGLYEPIAYTVLQKGKRLRPMLCLLANDMFGGNFEDAKYPALGLETGHNFSLIHDDIMDQAPLRRGMETVYKKWDTNTAILSGDVTLMLATQFMLHTSKPVEAVSLFNKVMIEIGEGQQYDMNFETQRVVTIPEYLEMIRLKTAVLLATSLQIGAVIAGADEEDQRNLYDFGIAMGMAFQLQDDILDCYSDVAVFGKVTGGDIVENKKTLMYLKALEMAQAADREWLEALFSGEVAINPQRKIDEVIALYDQLHVREAVEALMADYFRQASAYLDAVKLPEERKVHLRHYADLLSGREK